MASRVSAMAVSMSASERTMTRAVAGASASRCRVASSSARVGAYCRSTATAATAGGVEHDVHGHAVNPAGERRLAPEGAQALPQVHEYVLRQLDGAPPRSRHAQAQREHPRRVRAIQRFERALVPRRGASRQLPVVIGVIGDEMQARCHAGGPLPRWVVGPLAHVSWMRGAPAIKWVARGRPDHHGTPAGLRTCTPDANRTTFCCAVPFLTIVRPSPIIPE